MRSCLCLKPSNSSAFHLKLNCLVCCRKRTTRLHLHASHLWDLVSSTLTPFLHSGHMASLLFLGKSRHTVVLTPSLAVLSAWVALCSETCTLHFVTSSRSFPNVPFPCHFLSPSYLVATQASLSLASQSLLPCSVLVSVSSSSVLSNVFMCLLLLCVTPPCPPWPCRL